MLALLAGMATPSAPTRSSCSDPAYLRYLREELGTDLSSSVDQRNQANLVARRTGRHRQLCGRHRAEHEPGAQRFDRSSLVAEAHRASRSSILHLARRRPASERPGFDQLLGDLHRRGRGWHLHRCRSRRRLRERHAVRPAPVSRSHPLIAANRQLCTIMAPSTPIADLRPADRLRPKRHTARCRASRTALPYAALGYGVHVGPHTSASPVLVDQLRMDWVKVCKVGQVAAFSNKRVLFPWTCPGRPTGKPSA